ncbi:MAG TPA: sugar phosphate nucleotidyltransferase, partial [Acidimicrobiales bacterium]|nr:sugar phosphate nucleotidyltransferase [Acidimicrobiales bacterium]
GLAGGGGGPGGATGERGPAVKAVIMAGGEGVRLRPLTSTRPKPMLPVGNRPILEHVIRLLAAHGFRDIVVTVAYRADAVRTYFGDGGELDVRLSYVTEETPLGTAGSVRNARDFLDEPFLVISGDVLTDFDLGRLADLHRQRGAEATVALQARDDPLDFGMVITAPDGAVQRFVEKPSWGQVLSDSVNTGIYVIDPSVFDAIPAGRAVDFAGEVFPGLVAAGRRVYGCVLDGYWEDIGTLEAYVRVHRDLLAGRVGLERAGLPPAGGVHLGEGAELDPTVLLEGPVVVGADCRVEAAARIGADCWIGANVRVGSDASIERCVLHDNVYVGPGAHLRGAVVGRGSRIRRGATLEEGVVLGDDCLIGEQAVIDAKVAVYPAKTIEAGAVVTSSVVWESRRPRSLFAQAGVTGLANVDVTPEVATALAMAYAATVPRGSRLVVSRDTSRTGRVLKRAVIAGVNAGGVDVVDLEVATVPLTRFAVAARGAEGGITVRLAPDDPEAVVLRFFDEAGADIGASIRKRVERTYERRDARRALAGELGDTEPAGPIADDYTAAVVAIGGAAAGRRRPKVVVDYSYGAAGFVMPSVLAKLGADVLAVNPYASTGQAIAFDRAVHLAEVSRLVLASGADLGAVIDADGERITLVDDLGRPLRDDEAVVVLLSLVLDRGGEEAPAVVLPASARTAAAGVCRQRGAQLILTGLGRADLLDAARRPDVVFAAAGDGGYVFPRFLPAVDAVATLASTISLLAATDAHLSELAASVAPSAVAHLEVAVPWERTGQVMRLLLADLPPSDLLATEGMKVAHDDGWALVAPDPDRPSVHVLAEAASEPAAARRAESYAARVRAALAGTAAPTANH